MNTRTAEPAHDLESLPGMPTGGQLNRRQRMDRILERDGAACVWCRRPLDVGLVRATTDHLVPRVKGGPSWIENEVAACRRCNGQRGHMTPAEWYDECDRRGWNPNAHCIRRAFERLDAAIAQRGGQRRARPYVKSQLRRFRNLAPEHD